MLHTAILALGFASAAPGPLPNAGLDSHGDPLPHGASLRLGTVRFRGDYEHVVASRDGKRLVTVNRSELIVWDASSGRRVRRIEIDHVVGGIGLEVAIAPDGRTAAAGGESVGVWDLDSGRLLFKAKLGEAELCRCLAFSPDGRRLACGASLYGIAKEDRSSRVAVHDTRTGRIVLQFESAERVAGLAYSPDGRFIAAARDGVSLLDAGTGRQWRSFEALESAERVAFSADGRLLAAGYRNGDAAIFDVETWTRTHLFSGKRFGRVDGLEFSRDGNTLLAGAENFPLRLWDVRTSKLQIQPTALYDPCFGTFLGDGKQVAVWSGTGAIRIWNCETGREHMTFAGHVAGIDSMAVSRDSRFVATFASDAVILWELATGRMLWRREQAEDGSFGDVSFTPDGRWVTVSNSAEILFHDMKTGRETRSMRARASSHCFSADGRSLITGSVLLAERRDAADGNPQHTYLETGPPVPGRQPPPGRSRSPATGDTSRSSVTRG